MTDDLDRLLHPPVEPLAPPPGTFEAIAARARRRRRARLGAVLGSAAALVTAAALGTAAVTSAGRGADLIRPVAPAPDATAATTPASPAASPSAVPTPGRCRSAALTGSFVVIGTSAGAGNITALVTLTNPTATPCTLRGYVGMQLLGAGGAALPTDVVRVPATAAAVLLLPGGSATATVRFSPDVPGPGEPVASACEPTATAVEITPPDAYGHLTVAIEAAPGPGTAGATPRGTPVCEHGRLLTDPVAPAPAGS